MSKAFLRESDFDELPTLPTPAALLPPGTKNYLTPTGAQRLRNELAQLVDHERPRLIARASDPETKRDLQALDLRIRHLAESLRSAEIVPPPERPDGVVRFGASVTVREENGVEARYRLVGADETDPGQGSVSWISPLGRALLQARQGDRVVFRAPSGTKTLEIRSVEYPNESVA
jgi:transcription elongation factor GreB